MFILFFSCAPIEAPQDFDTLNSFLFENFRSDPEYPISGVQNLVQWSADNREIILEGFKVQDLSPEAIATVSDIYPEEMIGVAAAVEINYSVDDIAWLHFAHDPMDFYEESDAYNLREYTSDPDCFLRKECELLSYDSEIKEVLPLNIEAITQSSTEIRWVETASGTAYIHRRWVREEPYVSVDWAEVIAEYGFIVTIPESENTALRIESTWLDLRLDDIPISEDFGVSQGLKTLKNSIGNTEKNLDTLKQ